TITNTAKPATLTVKKVVVGGSASPSDFTLKVTDTTTNTVLNSSPGSSSGHQVSVAAGHVYTVTESGAQTANYTESDSAPCSTAPASGTPSCTITNTAKPPKPTRSKLKVIVRVVGGKHGASYFMIHVHGGHVKPHSAFKGSKRGTKVSLDSGSYSVSAGHKKG